MISPTQDTASNDILPKRVIWAMAVLYMLAALVLFYLLCAVWPADPVRLTSVQICWWSFEMIPDRRLIWLVIIASSLGSYIHTVTSFTSYAGSKNLASSWFAWYLLRPAISAALALIFYFSLRAGLFAGASADQTVNPFGIAAIAGMVGMFSKQATEKLSKIFDTIFA